MLSRLNRLINLLNCITSTSKALHQDPFCTVRPSPSTSTSLAKLLKNLHISHTTSAHAFSLLPTLSYSLSARSWRHGRLTAQDLDTSRSREHTSALWTQRYVQPEPFCEEAAAWIFESVTDEKGEGDPAEKEGEEAEYIESLMGRKGSLCLCDGRRHW